MRKLLLPFDGSENASRALRHAISLATAHPGSVTIHLVNVHERPDLYGEIAVYVSSEKMAELQRRQSEAVLGEAERVLADAGVPCTKEVLIGNTAQTIATRADELGCDSIVMGTRGMGAIGNLMMGSVATKVVHLANVPVTLVK